MVEKRARVLRDSRNRYEGLVGQWRVDVNVLLPGMPCAVQNRATLRPILVVVVVQQHKRKAALETISARNRNLANGNDVVVFGLCNACGCQSRSRPRNQRRDYRLEYASHVAKDQHSFGRWWWSGLTRLRPGTTSENTVRWEAAR